jgi:hypothetical protein
MGSLVGRPSRSSAEESQAVDHSTLYTLYGVRSNQDREYFKEREKNQKSKESQESQESKEKVQSRKKPRISVGGPPDSPQ